MRFRTLEIRWHDSKPISTCDFQPVAFKKARPAAGDVKAFAAQSYRLATGGEDNHVRLWMVHPNLKPAGVEGEDAAAAPRPARVEYLATLSRHSAAVNVVRFSPNGELIASAGDDGMIIIWAPSVTPQTSTYGSDLSAEDLQHEKEYWKPRTTFRCTAMQVYDLAWSPSCEYVLAGSTDNAARVFASADGKCMHEIAEHSHYVQGVAWDPLNEYIATQSSDRSMHIYRISTKQGTFEAHAVGKNTRLPYRHSRTPSAQGSRPRMFRSASIASDAESNVSEYPEREASTSGSTPSFPKDTPYSSAAPLTPATSVASTPSSMFPPPPMQPHEKPSSRRSSFSGSNAPSSPSTFSRYGRSPSPMPALPAIRTSPSTSWASVRLYGDESFTNFFRRLTFSPDGGLLLTPAGTFEDPSVSVSVPAPPAADEGTPARGRKHHRPSISTALADIASATASASSVYIYSRANFARPPIAQLPGHKKASVAVRFNPVLFELRPGVGGASAGDEPRADMLRERDVEGTMEVDLVGPLTGNGSGPAGAEGVFSPQQSSSQSQSQGQSIAAPAPQHAAVTSFNVMASPAMSPTDLRPPTPAASKPSTPAPSLTLGTNLGLSTPLSATGSVFALPYRMLYAVVTMDTVAVYDTQQSGPVCMLTKLHYDEFTDLTWSPDGQCLILSSRDGYCTLIIFDEILPTHHTQQHALQLQSIAHQHSVPISYSTSTSSTSSTGAPHYSGGGSIAGTPTSSQAHLPGSSVPRKRPMGEPPLTPAASVDGDRERDAHGHALNFTFPATASGASVSKTETDKAEEPPKKKRRVALTRVGDL
ncbi:WD40-repeat-containing domain protein [Mycena sp. CBHHK59/15]|nr:WD40-repeat-containing domain protein [Mycena sp. CBHHK59/15]